MGGATRHGKEFQPPGWQAGGPGPTLVKDRPRAQEELEPDSCKVTVALGHDTIRGGLVATGEGGRGIRGGWKPGRSMRPSVSATPVDRPSTRSAIPALAT